MQKENEARKLEKRRQKLIKSMPPWKEIIRGTVYGYCSPCGKTKCRCKENKKYYHGPYYYLSFGETGKTKMKLLPYNLKHKAIYNVQQYEKLWNNLCDISKINLELLLKSAKKNKKMI